ncbi:hypothetical protein KDJ91_13630 [Anaerobutyricum hallii]|uniref:Chromosome segregation ATPase n=1 Tax=Anaerobutyricum hallii DSM 3353 TaxID=411469 RepID=C0ESL8_9FIRM|nr:hypothetical protein [Anaerobutyricum hallii]EEG37739.1 hypothetical protein EUBHAL_00391 [Anaerobutyricum hallii DSM 3353]QUF80023.1 hypothetical protein KDJ91_13630 [Anaerobutyricum hallii]
MSKINAVRFINLNYNNNAMKINDECMQFSGKSTLLSLRNGGGKTVLVQMMTAPFVHRGKQKTKDRPFESYFTTAKPSFILVEWLLDGGAGYVLTGLMVRKNQEISEEKTDALEMMAIISEYKEPCMQDIHHLPVVEQNEKTMKLKSYNSCRKLFEDYKKDKKLSFFCYDMSSPAQSRQYFYKLMEYQINYKEWETIIRKVNVKESGLSELFSDCRTEKELVEKWFLEAVESKLNKEENKVKNFQEILEKYAGKYKNIKEQLKRRDAIQKFKEAAEEIQINAEDFLVKEGEKIEQEKVIAAFIARLNVLYEEAEIERERQEEGRKKLQEELEFLKYEQLSCEFHEKNREKRNHASNREMIDLEKESLLRKQQKIQKKVHVFLCAKQQEMVNEDKQEWEIRKEKAAISRTKEENLEPERNRIGGQLSGYYEYRLSDNKEKKEAIKKQKLQIRKDISQQKDILNEYREKTKKITESKGSFRSLVRGYDNIEIKYNSNYKENLSRNILGVYEAGMLDIKQEMYDKEQKKSIQENKEQKEKSENTTEEIHRTERAIEEKREKYFQKDSDIKQAEKEKKGYEQELEERKDILKYLELPEEKLFAREEILHKAKIKMQELSSRRRTLEKKEDALQKEYKLLVSGRVMELPDNLKEEFEKLDVPVVYGMEWLKKNGFTEKKNKEIVSQNPFLPYALILTRQELKKLSERNGETYTSFPIPIIERENLESIKLDRTQSFVKMQDIHFYILFNENLLDEEKMEIMIEQKQKDIADIRETMQICKNEYEDYFHRFDVIKRQAVTKENWDKIQKKLQKLEKEKEDIFQNIQQARDTKQSLKKNFEILQKTLRELEKKIESQAARQRAFKELRTAYAEYEENNKKLQEYEREEERLENRQHLTEEKISQLEENYRELSGQENSLFREEESIQNACQKFAAYKEINRNVKAGKLLGVDSTLRTDNNSGVKIIPSEAEVLKLEARYEAVTADISQELKELELEEEKALTRYHKSFGELRELCQKYNLKNSEWQNIIYDKREQLYQEAELEDYDKKIERKANLLNEEDKKIGILNSQLEGILKQIVSECGKGNPLEEEKISQKDLESAKNQTKYQLSELERKIAFSEKAIQKYRENLTALSEYNNFSADEEIHFEQDFKKMSEKELRDFKGMLIRDYNDIIRCVQKCRETLAQTLNKIARQEAFQDASYKTPLENMLKVCDDAAKVLRQLNITLESYDSLMKQLEVDISLVETEKKNVTELLEDYVQNIHKNLEKIGRNSTIKIREKSIKMLKVILPVWEDNEKLYSLRLSDFVDEITEEGIRLFENNENAQEYIGRKVTSKNLYDTVVGTGNVQIQLYKIEEQREQQISWNQVAKNSGGEGFLSAFVILSSLLDYMRKDDSDIFMDKNEGKVLLMDNPFAQTNAEHLLKPLMNLADKTNTQLICLTGLGGESIYNRFDNIYVLNLIEAHLRNGIQYLRPEHKKGEEVKVETILPTHIEVEEMLF